MHIWDFNRDEEICVCNDDQAEAVMKMIRAGGETPYPIARIVKFKGFSINLHTVENGRMYLTIYAPNGVTDLEIGEDGKVI